MQVLLVIETGAEHGTTGALPISNISININIPGQGASALKPEAFQIAMFLHAVAASF